MDEEPITSFPFLDPLSEIADADLDEHQCAGDESGHVESVEAKLDGEVDDNRCEGRIAKPRVCLYKKLQYLRVVLT